MPLGRVATRAPPTILQGAVLASAIPPDVTLRDAHFVKLGS